MKQWALGTLAVAVAMISVPATAVQAKHEVQQNAVQAAPDRVLVKVKAGKDRQAVANKHGGRVIDVLGDTGWIVVGTSGDVLEKVKRFKGDADVEAAELDALVSVEAVPNDPGFASQWHLTKIQADLAWDLHQGSPNRTIAIVDTGVDLANPEFAGKIVAGYDFVNNDGTAQDDQGHGTFVASVATALGNNGVGGAGVDWHAKVMPVKVLNASGSGTISAIISGINFAANNGAHVINLSIGGGSFSQAFQDAINAAWSKGAVLVASVGGSATTAVSYPAAYANVISVASTTSSDVRSSFSSYGTWVDLAAPGSSIYSSALGGMSTMSGTSFSAAIVSGVASLAWGKNSTLNNAGLVNRLFTTADNIAGTGTYWANGRVNALKAVRGY